MEDKQVAKRDEGALSTRFMNKITSEFRTGVGELALTDFQKRLAQNYFMAVDFCLKSAEIKRLKKREKDRDPLPVVWANVNMEGLAQSVVACARIGLDPAQKNHVAMMPFKNSATNKYDLVFVDGYRGIELKARKYGLDVPDWIVVELVYSTDSFKSIKRGVNHQYESYDFQITNDFNRGDIIGGFYFHGYRKYPERNKLVVMSLEDILKRKPRYASVEFWGGERDVWVDGKKTGKETVTGWFEKMAWKTVYRAAYSDVTIDSQKIDHDFLHLRRMEEEYEDERAQEEITQGANAGDVIDVDEDVAEQEPPKTLEPPPRGEPEKASPAKTENPPPPEPRQPPPQSAPGPDF